ncbi:hypothetical protein OG21DRAFT_1527446 [Imleria badia]|nr:hypothetical protein OG21DRAFT_1527446 [Imleria badia]
MPTATTREALNVHFHFMVWETGTTFDITILLTEGDDGTKALGPRASLPVVGPGSLPVVGSLTGSATGALPLNGLPLVGSLTGSATGALPLNGPGLPAAGSLGGRSLAVVGNPASTLGKDVDHVIASEELPEEAESMLIQQRTHFSYLIIHICFLNCFSYVYWAAGSTNTNTVTHHVILYVAGEAKRQFPKKKGKKKGSGPWVIRNGDHRQVQVSSDPKLDAVVQCTKTPTFNLDVHIWYHPSKGGHIGPRRWGQDAPDYEGGETWVKPPPS